jgi:hypothetical protein
MIDFGIRFGGIGGIIHHVILGMILSDMVIIGVIIIGVVRGTTIIGTILILDQTFTIQQLVINIDHHPQNLETLVVEVMVKIELGIVRGEKDLAAIQYVIEKEGLKKLI